MSSARSLTITIVNHNHWRWIQDCLESIATHPYTLGRCELVVVDNASEDGSVERIRERFPTVRVIPRSLRQGFGANQNDAVDIADTDLVFLMNPDAIVHEGTLDLLAEAFDIDDTIVIAAGPDTGSDQSPPVPRPYPFPTPMTALLQALHVNPGRDRDSVAELGLVEGWVSGHALMVDRRRFVEVGGFDTSFFMYSEEVDLMRRMRDCGWSIAWVNAARTTHIGKTSEAALRGSTAGPRDPSFERTTVQFARSEVKYMRKHTGAIGVFAFRSASALDAAIRYAATWIPMANRGMVPKGPTTRHTRMHHLARLRVYLGDRSLPDMRDSAETWNVRAGRSP